MIKLRPLHYACMNGHPETARTPVAHGSDIDGGSSAVIKTFQEKINI